MFIPTGKLWLRSRFLASALQSAKKRRSSYGPEMNTYKYVYRRDTDDTIRLFTLKLLKQHRVESLMSNSSVIQSEPEWNNQISFILTFDGAHASDFLLRMGKQNHFFNLIRLHGIIYLLGWRFSFSIRYFPHVKTNREEMTISSQSNQLHVFLRKNTISE